MSGSEYNIKAVFSVVDKISAHIGPIKTRLKALDKTFSRLQRAGGKLASSLAMPLAIIAGAGLLSIKNAVNGFMELGDSIDKASARAGVGAEALQKLRYAANLSGAENEQLDNGLMMLNKNMAAAASGGNKKLASMFQHLGISLRDSNGNVRGASDVMLNLAEAMKNNESGAARMQIATTAFGKAGASLIPMLAGGADALKKMQDEAEELGIVMSEKNVKAAVEFKDELTRFQRVAKSVSSVIGSALAPALTDVLKEMKGAIIANRALIRARLAELVERLAAAIKKIDWNKVIKGIFDLIDGVGKVIDMLGGLEGIMWIIVGFKFAGLVKDIYDFGVAVVGVVQAFSAVIAAVGAIPVLIGVAIAAAIAILWTIYSNWDDICEFVSARVREVGEFFNQIWTNVTQFFIDAWNGAIDWVLEKLNFLSNTVTGIFEGIKNAWNSITSGGGIPTGSLGGRGANGSVDINVRADRGTQARLVNQSGGVNTSLFGTAR